MKDVRNFAFSLLSLCIVCALAQTAFMPAQTKKLQPHEKPEGGDKQPQPVKPLNCHVAEIPENWYTGLIVARNGDLYLASRLLQHAGDSVRFKIIDDHSITVSTSNP